MRTDSGSSRWTDPSRSTAEDGADGRPVRVAEGLERRGVGTGGEDLGVRGHRDRAAAVPCRGGELGVAREAAGVPVHRSAPGAVSEDREPRVVLPRSRRVRAPLYEPKLAAPNPPAEEPPARVGAHEPIQLSWG